MDVPPSAQTIYIENIQPSWYSCLYTYKPPKEGNMIKRSFNEIIQQLANGGLKYEENIGTLQALV